MDIYKKTVPPSSSMWQKVVIPCPPDLVSPANGAINQPYTVTLRWDKSLTFPFGNAWHVQVSDNINFSGTLLVDDDTLKVTTRDVSVVAGGTYYWRVKERDDCWSKANVLQKAPESEFSSIFSFTVRVPDIYTNGSSTNTYRSQDGLLWTIVGTHSVGSPSLYENIPIVSLGTNLFAGSYGAGVFLSTNDGATWTAKNTGLTNLYVWSLAVIGTSLFAGTEAGVFLSTDNGDSWSSVSTGLSGLSLIVHALCVSGTNLFAGTDGGVFLSTNNGATWNSKSTGLNYNDIRAVATDGTYLYAADGTYGVFRSADNGDSWIGISTGISLLHMTTIYCSDLGEVIAGTYSEGIYCSIDQGDHWIELLAPTTIHSSIFNIVVIGNNLFAASNFGIFHYLKTGSTWAYVDKLLTNIDIRSFTKKEKSL